MIDVSKIQWTGSTWNPWIGCKKKSAGCKHCYMWRSRERRGDPSVVTRTSPTTFKKPYKWQREVGKGIRTGNERLVFTCSWSDFFNEEADSWRHAAWQVIKETPDLIYQVLTKLPERINAHLPDYWNEIVDRVWLGTSIENQDSIGRLSSLLETPANIRFLSLEPLLGPITFPDLNTPIGIPAIDWIIIGGESGNKSGKYKARPMNTQWVELLIDYGQEYGIPIFVKQLGSYYAQQHGLRDKSGGDISEWATHLQIRQFPVIS